MVGIVTRVAENLQVAMERVLGTVTGGLLGYGLATVNDALPFLDQPFFTVIAATAVAFSSIILGYKLRLDYSGRLFIMTFILVVMAAPKTEGTRYSHGVPAFHLCQLQARV